MATEADFARIGNYARMYNADQNIARLKVSATRTVPMQVLCLGASRTGTMTMHRAMELLGIPNPQHFSSVYDNTLDAVHWLAALDAKHNGKGTLPDKAFFDAMLGHSGAVTDAPFNLFAEELIRFYPEAKVVLVERDIDSWYESWMKFCESAYDPTISSIAKDDPDFLGRIGRLGDAITRPQAGFADDLDKARVRSRAAYRHHYMDVKAWTPPERLLEFKLSDGWEPLCAFLGLDVPDMPFPHMNDAAANKQSFVELAQLSMKRVAARKATDSNV